MEMFIFSVLAFIILFLLYDNRKLEGLANHLVDKYRNEQAKVKTLEMMFNVKEDDYIGGDIDD